MLPQGLYMALISLNQTPAAHLSKKLGALCARCTQLCLEWAEDDDLVDLFIFQGIIFGSDPTQTHDQFLALWPPMGAKCLSKGVWMKKKIPLKK